MTSDPDHDPTPLGDYIRRQREVSELSMRQFAEMVGISNPYLSQIERGLRAPSERVVDAIAEALRVSSDTLREHAAPGAPSGAETPAVVSAIGADEHLTGRQRQALLEVYAAFTGWQRPRPARPGPEG